MSLSLETRLKTRLKAVWLRVRAVARQRQLDRDLDDELAFHLAMREQAHREAGASEADARTHARRQFGSPARVKESLGDLWQWRSLDRLAQDLRFATRAARRQPTFTIVVVLTLALGIGATTAMFGIVDAVMLRPFPFPQPDRLVAIWETNRERGIHTFTGSMANYADWEAATRTRRDGAERREAATAAVRSGSGSGSSSGASMSARADDGARQGRSAFAELGAWEPRNDNRTDGARPEQVQGALASSALFRALQIRPAAGRFFRPDEDQPANRHVAVLGYEYWRRVAGGDPAIVGRAVVVNGESYTVVGVAPPLRPPFRADIWRPLAPDVAALDRGDHSLLVVGRLAAGQSRAAAEAELQTIAARLASAYPGTNRGWSVRVESLYDALVVDGTRRAMLILMGAVALLLLIACVNVANLMLARGTGRQREVATRLALGASRGRIVRQLFTESALLAGAGGVAGLLVAGWGLQLTQWLPATAEIAGLDEARLNPYALAFAAAVALLTTIGIGLVPALQLTGGGGARRSRRSTSTSTSRTSRTSRTTSSGGDSSSRSSASNTSSTSSSSSSGNSRSRGSGRSAGPSDADIDARGGWPWWPWSGGAQAASHGSLMLVTRTASDAPRTRRMRHALVVTEIALALVLLIGAGLLIRSLDRLRHVPLGFNADRVLTAKIGLYAKTYETQARYVDFIDRLLRDLQARPGVGAAGIASSVPFGGGYTVRQTWRESEAADRSAEGVLTNWRVIGGDYFKAMGIPLLEGRLFQAADDGRVPRVTIVSDALAQRLWPGEHPIGKKVLAGDSRRPYEVVGVVGHTRLIALGSDPGPTMYYHYRQFSWASMTVAVRANGEPAALENTVRAAVAAIDRDQPVFDVQPMRDRIDRAVATPQMHASLLALFAALALTLSAVGVYGVMSYSAAQRTSEIGVRLALGAQRRDVLLLVWRRGIALTAIGLTLGLAIALLAGRALGTLLYDVSPADVPTYAAGVGVMLLVALTACYIPARLAMHTDPVVALKHE